MNKKMFATPELGTGPICSMYLEIEQSIDKILRMAHKFNM